MSAVKGPHGAAAGSNQGWRPLGLLEVWHRTPWWVIWRPAWRRQMNGWQHFGFIYQTHRERARDVLRQKFDEDRPTQEAGVQQDSRRYPQTAIVNGIRRRMPKGRPIR